LRCKVQTALHTRLETVLRCAVAVPLATSRFVMAPTFHPALKIRTEALVRGAGVRTFFWGAAYDGN
jgi:hypothetical protein